ncbi:unnamed protein product [Adineta steineri]|uniref:Uncharacterized protein n=1 Tax=Adineta steineri TaxID=433720 RepID=A0A815F995_9BILA|nr:unnamed protein product [Adineta steineri]
MEDTTTNDISSDKKKNVHRRMASLPLIHNFLAKSKQLLSSSSPEISPIVENLSEESDNVTLLSSSSSVLVDTQQSNNLSSDSINISSDDKSFNDQTSVGYLPNTDSSNSTMVIVTSPSFTSDLLSEQNDSIDQLNSSSLSFLQTKQRRIDHRRNKSEPIKSASTEDLASSTILDLSSNNESSIGKKSSVKLTPNNSSPLATSKQLTLEKVSSQSSTTSRKKKPWYNVSIISYYFFIG